MLTRTLAVACLLALLVAACGGGDDTETPQGRPTLTDPASVPTAVPDEDRDPFITDQSGTRAPGDPLPATVVAEQPAPRTYTVQEGDTCGQIAADHSISVDALIAANPRINEECTNLHVDEVLNIPAPDPSTSTSSSSTSDGGGSEGRTYIVVAGDTCAAIAQDHGVALPTFMVANGLDEESCQTLQIDQEVVIPE